MDITTFATWAAIIVAECMARQDYVNAVRFGRA